MENLLNHYDLFINGKWQASKESFESHSPINGKLLATCSQASKEDVDDAVDAAALAFERYKLTSAYERAALLNKIADTIEANKEHLAMVETQDNGKPIRESLSVDIPSAIQHFRYFAGVILADEGKANYLEDGSLSLIFKEPIGVVGQIIPWNFPLLMAAWKLAPLLAAGCTCVIKPSMSTSLSLLELMRLIEGFLPAGVINVITGSGAKAGEYILNHPGFAKLAFTGSTQVGCAVANAAAKALIPSTLELGGKSANIIFDDCDLDLALDGAQIGILFNQGQVCCAGSRILVQESIYDDFVSKLAKKFAKIKVLPSYEKSCQMGALISARQLEKVQNYIKIGLDEGAKLAAGGKRLSQGELANGYFLEPTLLSNVSNEMRVAREEIFGPVACVIKFKDELEAISIANDSAYGLAAGIWSKDIKRAFRVAKSLEAGRVWVNTYNAVPAGAPFGGYKRSGIGRETHAMILNHYTQVKNVFIGMKEGVSGLY